MAAYDQNGQRHIKLLLAAALNAALEYRNTVAGNVTQLRIDCDTAPSGGSVVFTLYKIVSGTKTTIGTATLAAGAHVATASFASALTGGEIVGVDMGLPPSAIGNALTITVSVTEPAPATGSVVYPHTPPATPDSHDDEFEGTPGTTFDAKWTNNTTAGASYDINQTMPSGVILKANGNFSISLTQAFTPGTADFSVTWCNFGCFDSNNQNHLGAVQDGSGNNILRWVLFCNGSTPSHYCDINSGFTTSLSAVSIGITPFVGTFFYHMQRISNVYELYWSLNGISWMKKHNVTISTTVGKFWYFFGQNTATTKARHGAHWIRFNSLFLP
jgi:hypothetical protein